jgi:hypothetical protein
MSYSLRRRAVGIDWLFWRPATHRAIRDDYHTICESWTCGDLAQAWKVCEFYDAVEEEQARKAERKR